MFYVFIYKKLARFYHLVNKFTRCSQVFYFFADINNPNIRLDDLQIHFIEIKRFAEILKNASIDEYNRNKLLSWIDFFTTKDLEKDINKLVIKIVSVR